jgi:hypothetical protein
MKSAKDLLEDVPLPKANDLFLATAAATLGSGLLTVAKPEKMHDAYFTESDDDGATQVMHKPSTRWLGMSLCWVGAWNVAAALAPEGSAKAKEKLLLANGAGLLAGTTTRRRSIAIATPRPRRLASVSIERAVSARPRRRTPPSSRHPRDDGDAISWHRPSLPLTVFFPSPPPRRPGAAMDSYNIAKKTQKKKVSAAEICTIGTLGALSLARAAKGCKDE